MYTPTQIEAIKIFENKKRKLEKDIIRMKYGTCISYQFDEVHLEDIFRVSKYKLKKITIEYYTQGPHIIINPIEVNLRDPERISFDPTIPVLEQPEETLKQLISLFK